jgi:hypothetical protein
MKEIPLSKTNPYLQNIEQYEKLIITNVISSSAIEIGTVSAHIIKKLNEKNSPKVICLSDY